ncbi:OLC1v1012676C1 [Oldenlandia corymbosa var. corymbosa]|uniref:OLC1v1012676C1 n=1 Tax=Oldenlandia corymbosa var. corymbosa TaxID=529605 RepID=A0AAV1DWI6_OLDCO|nr:OLC1v1012676C1 [Oldenlandia corymbosa var. corymbosa]
MDPRQKVAAKKISNKKLGFGVIQEAPQPLPQLPTTQQKAAQKALRTKIDPALFISEAAWNLFERTRNWPLIVERGVDTETAPALGRRRCGVCKRKKCGHQPCRNQNRVEPANGGNRPRKGSDGSAQG